MRQLLSLILLFKATSISLILGQNDTIDYFNQTPPGTTPKLFAPGIISTDKNELNIAFTHDGNECFFTEWKNGVNTIMTIQKINGNWSERRVASFSGQFSDVDPYISHDGKKLYFSSMRPLQDGNDPKDSDIWYVEKIASSKWGNPTRLNYINSIGSDDYYTSLTNNDIIYFSIFESHGRTGDLYKAKFGETPVQLEAPINTEYNEHDPFVAPDESYLIFTSNRPGGFGRGDLYISFQNENGNWSNPVNMGEDINTASYEFTPMLSPCGNYLFFTRNKGGNGDIYWVSTKIIDFYR